MAPLKFKVYGELTEVKRKLILCVCMYANLWRKPCVQEYLEEQLLTPIRSYVKVRQDLETRGS